MEALKEVQQFSSYLNQYTKDVRFDELKNNLKSNLNEDSSVQYKELLKKESLNEINSYLYVNNLPKIELELLQRLLVENITYTSLRTVYLEEIESHVTKEDVTRKLKGFFNKKMHFLPDNVKETKEDLTFYSKMIDIKIEEMNKIYIPVICEVENLIYVFFAYKAQKKNDEGELENIINCATAVIDIDNEVISVHVKNDFSSVKADQFAISSPEKFFYSIIEIISNDLGISLKPRRTKDTKEKIFNYCKELNRKIIEDYKDDVQEKISDFSSDMDNVLKKISNSLEIEEEINEKINSKLVDIFVGEFIIEKYSSLDLRKKALEKGLFGYPTRLEYKSKDASNSKTSSKSSGEPLPIHEIFHSINAVFKDNSILNEVRIAWFEKYLFASEGSYENKSSTSQTSIKITTKYTSINFTGYSKVNMEMVNFVLQEIRKILS